MEIPPPVSAELRNLIDDLLNGRIDTIRHARLECLLTESEQARAFYAAYCQLHLDIVMDQHSEHVVRMFLVERNRCDESTSLAAGASQERLADSRQDSARPVQTRSRFAWAIAASLMLAAMGIWRLANSFESTPLAIISGVEVDDRSVKLAIANVGTAYLENSANFTIIGPKRARLSNGRIKMRVSEAAGHGFVVETPYGEVTDLGTEFGLDVDDRGGACVVVFEGSVDLSVQNDKSGPDVPSHVERLTSGEGLFFDSGGRLDRVSSISSGTVNTFLRDTHSIAADRHVIANVTDNLRQSETKKFYDIVTGGLREDALAYVDRPHDWNGITEAGMPQYLVGADYVRTFNDDKGTSEIEIQLELSQPAHIFVFLDSRVEIPEWLNRDFTRTGDMIGLDEGQRIELDKHIREIGPGKFDTKFQVWRRDVTKPGSLTLGPNGKLRANVAYPTHLAMYGIAAKPFTSAPAKSAREPRSLRAETTKDARATQPSKVVDATTAGQTAVAIGGRSTGI